MKGKTLRIVTPETVHSGWITWGVSHYFIGMRALCGLWLEAPVERHIYYAEPWRKVCKKCLAARERT